MTRAACGNRRGPPKLDPLMWAREREAAGRGVRGMTEGRSLERRGRVQGGAARAFSTAPLRTPARREAAASAMKLFRSGGARQGRASGFGRASASDCFGAWHNERGSWALRERSRWPSREGRRAMHRGRASQRAVGWVDAPGWRALCTGRPYRRHCAKSAGGYTPLLERRRVAQSLGAYARG